jgi:antitoxin component YwqK of YwqJK toxin-antitoxin module
MIFRFTLIAALLLARAAFAETEADKKFIEKYKSALPAGYTVKAEYYIGSDRLQALTPLDPEGKIDGEALTIVQYGWDAIRSVPYKKGVVDGIEKEWDYAAYENKQVRYLKKETPWKAGKIDGIKKLYHPNGKLMQETTFVMGVTGGPSKTYTVSGQLERETSFKDGKRHGDMTEYYAQTGKPKNVIPYNGGKVDGVMREFYDNGKPKREAVLKNEEYHGIEKRYDEDGKVVKTIYWLNDKEVAKQEFDAKFK